MRGEASHAGSVSPAVPVLETHVISLVRSADRRAASSAALAGLGIGFGFVEAVDAAGGFSPEQEARIDRAAIRRNLGRTMSAGEIACAMSHNLAYRRFLQGRSSHALILEDDALPGPQLPRLLASGEYAQVPMLLLYAGGNLRVRRRGALNWTGGIEAWRLALPAWGATAYIISREAGVQLQKATDRIVALADWPCDIVDLRAYLTWPLLVEHPPRIPRQSLLEGGRTTDRRFGLSRYFSADYLRRKWRKAGAGRLQ